MMKSVTNFLQLKVPDNIGYEQRVYSEQFHFEEHARVRYRRIGAISSLIALSLYVFCMDFHSHWTRHEHQNGWSSLWDSCYLPSSANKTSSPSSATSDMRNIAFAGRHTDFAHLGCFDVIENWQKAVIGLLIFSIAFAFIGSIFAVAGVCSQYIPKKMYYYHSSGEIFFVSAMTATVALAIYPYTVSNIMMYTKYNFGYGYGMAWTATVLLYVSAFTMMMDELIRESTRQRLQKLCNLRRKFDRYQTRQPSLPDNV